VASPDPVTLLSIGGSAAASLVVSIRREDIQRPWGDPWFRNPWFDTAIAVKAHPFAGTPRTVFTLADRRPGVRDDQRARMAHQQRAQPLLAEAITDRNQWYARPRGRGQRDRERGAVHGQVDNRLRALRANNPGAADRQVSRPRRRQPLPAATS